MLQAGSQQPFLRRSSDLVSKISNNSHSRFVSVSCRLGSASDYVEISPGLEGGPAERYCGDTAPPTPLISDGARLR